MPWFLAIKGTHPEAKATWLTLLNDVAIIHPQIDINEALALIRLYARWGCTDRSEVFLDFDVSLPGMARRREEKELQPVLAHIVN